MKKLTISSVVLVLLLVGILFYSSIDHKKYDKLKTYNYDKKCSYNLVENIDDDIEKSVSNVYIKLDNLNVSNAVFQTILEKNSYSNNLDMQKDILSLYDNISGISYDVYETKNNYVIEIKYDYSNLDIKSLKTKLDGLLDENSIIMNIDKIPFTFDTLLKYDLKNYECK